MADRLKELAERGRWDEAVRLLHDELHERVKRYIYKRWAAAPVDDVSQVVWVAVRGALPGFRFEALPEVWVFGIARLKVIDEQRRRREVVGIDPDAAPMRWSDKLTDASSPFARLLYTERARVIRQIISQWADDDRRMFEMRFFADMDPAEIADTFEPPKLRNTVTKRLGQLVKVLRVALASITSVPS